MWIYAHDDAQLLACEGDDGPRAWRTTGRTREYERGNDGTWLKHDCLSQADSKNGALRRAMEH
jgi:hypothetical protein